MKFRKKPVEVEAFEWTGKNPFELREWWSAHAVDRLKQRFHINDDLTVSIPTLEGTMLANVGDYIICGVSGEFYPCKPDIFEKTYEPVMVDVSEKIKAIQNEIANDPAHRVLY